MGTALTLNGSHVKLLKDIAFYSTKNVAIVASKRDCGRERFARGEPLS